MHGTRNYDRGPGCLVASMLLLGVILWIALFELVRWML